MKVKIKSKTLAIVSMAFMCINLIGCERYNSFYDTESNDKTSESAIASESATVSEEASKDNTGKAEDISNYRNEYFPYVLDQEEEYSVIKFFEEDVSTVPVNIKKLESYEKGDVYRITVQYEDVPERYYWGVTDRYDLGTFYVTEDTIYMMYGGDNIPKEEEFIKSGIIVCSEKDYEQNTDDVESKITHEGDECTFTTHETTESGFYSSYTWVKGKGLAYYRSGYGAEGDPIEIALK